ncbi:hypothetical protein [Nocardia niigatensis]|uniref:hypothetical protein n=1 Tax=Nocardia niigatensis TaxID=209249 RepID=UPI0002D3F40E|nr:hypothetical protein [Nocardia niigatensis]
MSGTVRIRLSGNRADITRVLADLIASHAFRVTVDERTYLDRSGGVRVYAELAVPGQETWR